MVIVDTAIRRAELEPRQKLFESKERDRDKRLSWALDYTPKINELLRIVKSHWHIISDLPGCQSFSYVGLHKTKSLKDILVKSKIQEEDDSSTLTVFGHHRCAGCSVCHLTMQVSQVEFQDLGFTHYIRGFSTRNTRMCVYLFICECQKRYIGSTHHKIKVRIQEH